MGLTVCKGGQTVYNRGYAVHEGVGADSIVGDAMDNGRRLTVYIRECTVM